MDTESQKRVALAFFEALGRGDRIAALREHVDTRYAAEFFGASLRGRGFRQ